MSLISSTVFRLVGEKILQTEMIPLSPKKNHHTTTKDRNQKFSCFKAQKNLFAFHCNQMIFTIDRMRFTFGAAFICPIC